MYGGCFPFWNMILRGKRIVFELQNGRTEVRAPENAISKYYLKFGGAISLRVAR